MAKLTDEQRKLHNALNDAYWHAKREIEYWKKQVKEKPLYGWSQEKHEKYCMDQILKASAAEDWLFSQLMRINPD